VLRAENGIWGKYTGTVRFGIGSFPKAHFSFSTLIAWFAESGSRNAPCCVLKSKLLVSRALLRQSVIPDVPVAPASQLKGEY
jgi:hypothetical protein